MDCTRPACLRFYGTLGYACYYFSHWVDVNGGIADGGFGGQYCFNVTTRADFGNGIGGRHDTCRHRKHQATGYWMAVGLDSTHRTFVVRRDCRYGCGAVLARETGLEWAAIWAVKESWTFTFLMVAVFVFVHSFYINVSYN